MYLVVGLGNPGPGFEESPHNAGFRVLDRFAREEEWKENHSPRYRFLTRKISGKEVFLLKPLTSMNNSGRALKEVLSEKKIPLEKTVILHDDFALPLGRIKISRNRGPGHHKGVSSVIKEVGKGVVRIRVGTGKEKEGLSLAEFVLRPLKGKKREKMKRGEKKAEKAIRLLLGQGVDKAMTVHNRR